MAVSASTVAKRNPFAEKGHRVGGYRNETEATVREQARMLRANGVNVLVRKLESCQILRLSS